ncbi:MAG: hypothetical protein ACT4P0_08310 [Panacagrimonas sp.]
MTTEKSFNALPKLMVGASSGGHANELLLLLKAAKGLWPLEPAAYVTTMDITAQGFTHFGKPVHVIGEGDRRKPLRTLAVVFRALWLAMRERPDIVVTTGSMPLAIFCIWSRLLGSQIVWIDSVAQVDKMSLSGRVMTRVANLCLVQWPDLAVGRSRVEYAGEVL